MNFFLLAHSIGSNSIVFEIPSDPLPCVYAVSNTYPIALHCLKNFIFLKAAVVLCQDVLGDIFMGLYLQTGYCLVVIMPMVINEEKVILESQHNLFDKAPRQSLLREYLNVRMFYRFLKILTKITKALFLLFRYWWRRFWPLISSVFHFINSL